MSIVSVTFWSFLSSVVLKVSVVSFVSVASVDLAVFVVSIFFFFQ